ncbi:MAG: hypothetical protein KDD04_09945 [Sinomicrobium sp.]|nr:hypothetical protein [Sinomicrobium sp.]
MQELYETRKEEMDTSFLPLTRENLQKIKNKEFCIIQVPVFSKSVCEQLLTEFSNVPFPWTKFRRAEAVQHVPLMGISLWDYYDDLRDYVMSSLKLDALLNKYVPTRKAAIAIIRAMLKEANGADVGPVFIEQYQAHGFTGMGKHLFYANTHTDFVPRDAPDDFPFPKIKNQIAMNLVLSDVPEGAGGECLVFNKMYEPEDDAYLLPPPTSFGYRSDLFLDVEFKAIPQVQGSFFIFPSEYYHCVLPCQADRYTMSFFMGELEDGRLAMWT